MTMKGYHYYCIIFLCWLQIITVALASNNTISSVTDDPSSSVIDDDRSSFLSSPGANINKPRNKNNKSQPRQIRGSSSSSSSSGSASIPEDVHSRSLLDLTVDGNVGEDGDPGDFEDKPPGISIAAKRKDPPVTNKDQFKFGRDSQREIRFPPTKPPTMVPSESPSIRPTTEAETRNYFQQFDRPIRVACAGGSLTRGEAGGNLRVYSYPNQLQGLLGPEDEIKVLNFGRTGATAIKDLDTSYVDYIQFQWSMDAQPDIYLFMMGTTDARHWSTHANDFREDFKQITNQVRATVDPEPRFLVAFPPWVKGGNDFGITSQLMLKEIQPRIRHVAGSKGLQLVDMYSVTKGRQDLYVSDGVHLNADGYGVLAQAWANAIQCNQNGICEVGETCEACPGDCFMGCPP